MSMSKEKKDVIKSHVHVEYPVDTPKQSRTYGQWFNLIFFIVGFLTLVSLFFIVSNSRELPTMSDFIDSIRKVPSVDVDNFIVTDDIFAWIKVIPLVDVPKIFVPFVEFFNGVIVGFKGWLKWIFFPIDVFTWVGSSLIQLMSFIWYFVSTFFYGLA